MSLRQNNSGNQNEIEQENPDIPTKSIDCYNPSALKYFETHNGGQKSDDKSQCFRIRHKSIRFIT